jgi:hypothetical protein
VNPSLATSRIVLVALFLDAQGRNSGELKEVATFVWYATAWLRDVRRCSQLAQPSGMVRRPTQSRKWTMKTPSFLEKLRRFGEVAT